jgi:hypothetical protein
MEQFALVSEHKKEKRHNNAQRERKLSARSLQNNTKRQTPEFPNSIHGNTHPLKCQEITPLFR